MKRIIDAIKAAIYFYKHPLVFQTGVLQMTEQIMEMLRTSIETDTPMRSKLVIHDEGGSEEKISLWCSTGDRTPEKRIDELLAQNSELKQSLKELHYHLTTTDGIDTEAVYNAVTYAEKLLS